MESMRFFGLILILLLAGCNQRNAVQESDSAEESTMSATDLERVGEGMFAPDFALESKDGDLIALSSFRGQSNVVLVFYRGYW